MEDLRRESYPMRLLDESVFAPRSTIPNGSEPDEAPVLLVQATLITGGLVLTFVAHHCAMDIIGQAFVMGLLSKACRNEPFEDEELRIGNMKRENIFPAARELQARPRGCSLHGPADPDSNIVYRALSAASAGGVHMGGL